LEERGGGGGNPNYHRVGLKKKKIKNKYAFGKAAQGRRDNIGQELILRIELLPTKLKRDLLL